MKNGHPVYLLVAHSLQVFVNSFVLMSHRSTLCWLTDCVMCESVGECVK